jgi:BirA family biotin operon repressor/biotin-[acetyl-CoA-carboxylase] ligase
MGSRYQDLDRPPLSEPSLRRGLAGAGAFYTELRVVAETGSTNSDLAVEARAGAPEGLVEIAEYQRAGRGRLDRVWSAPPRSGLAFSVLVRPGVAQAQWGWLPLLTGLAASVALTRLTELPIRLKWPNDLIVTGTDDHGADSMRKLGGILVERVADAAVVGVGVNVTVRPEEFPSPTATSLAVLGAATTDRDPLLRAVLREFAARYQAWSDDGEDALRDDYRGACATLGRTVRVELPGSAVIEGEALDVDVAGRLVVWDGSAERAVTAGDVVHVR